jgi:hypothetical protein
VKKTKTPRDPNKRAFHTIQLALGEVEPEQPAKDPERVERGKKGGLKGGKLRAERLRPECRSEIARATAEARWRRTGEG